MNRKKPKAPRAIFHMPPRNLPLAECFAESTELSYFGNFAAATQEKEERNHTEPESRECNIISERTYIICRQFAFCPGEWIADTCVRTFASGKRGENRLLRRVIGIGLNQ